jgi:DNA-binding CsgD family transcriptional regulator
MYRLWLDAIRRGVAAHSEAAMDRSNVILDAVRKLYEAVLEPDGLEKALPTVTTAVGGDGMILLGQDLRTERVEFTASSGFGPKVAAAKATACEAAMMAPWLSALRFNVALQSSAVMPDRDFVRSDFYNESVRATGTFYAALAAPRYTPHHRSFAAICRVLGSADFNIESIRTLRVLVPHLVTALRVRHQFGEAKLHARSAYAVLNRLQVGIVLTDAAARPRFVNTRAEAIAAEADGFYLGSRGITAALPAETRALQRAIAAAATVTAKLSQSDTTDTILRSATSSAEARVHLSRPSLRAPLTVIVMPLSDVSLDGTWGAPHQVAVFVIEPDRPPEINTRALAETYRLAPREVQVAKLLAQGHRPAQIASELGIGVGTVREHLKRVLAKTDTHRQADLVRLLLRGFATSVY